MNCPDDSLELPSWLYSSMVLTNFGVIGGHIDDISSTTWNLLTTSTRYSCADQGAFGVRVVLCPLNVTFGVKGVAKKGRVTRYFGDY
jgi:hypothetical protein